MGAAFKLEEIDGVSIIKCPSVIELNSELEVQVKRCQESKAEVRVVDFAGVTEFREKAYRPFILLNQAIKARGKRLYAINTSSALNRQFLEDGLSSVFHVVKDVREAK